jgi:hypothetical protein
MKIIAIFVSMLFLILSGISCIGNNFDFNEISCLEKKISFGRLDIKVDRGNIYLELIGANQLYLRKDYYIVPTRVETYNFPVDTIIREVMVKPIDLKCEEIHNKLMVAPEPILLDQQNLIENSNDNIKPKAVDFWYNYDIGIGIIGNQRILLLKIQFFPVQYRDSENMIEWAGGFEVKIFYENSNNKTNNFKQEEYDLLILSNDDYIDDLQDLASHKTDMGISSKLVSLNDIYQGLIFPVEGRDEPEIIKYFIKNAIEYFNIKYVLLVGGENEFPTRITHVFVDYNEGDAEEFVSDLYYADIYNENMNFCSWDSNNNDVFGEFNWSNEQFFDDVDLYPDVYLGRLACVNEFEVKSCVDKIIEYEIGKAYTQDWFTELILCGGDTAPGDDEEIDEGEFICNTIENIMTGFTAEKLYASNGGLNTAINMRNKFNEGSGFLVLSGHANPGSWATHPHENDNLWLPPNGFTISDAKKLNNQARLPILLTDSCSPFKFNVRDDCIGWSFVSNDKGGVIGGFGCTGLSWGTDGISVISYLTSKLMIDTINSYKKDGASTIGMMWSMGINEYIYPGMDSGDYKTIEEWELFGDPSLIIAEESIPPIKPTTPLGPSTAKINSNIKYSTYTSDPDGEKIYYKFDWGDGSDSGWIGPFESGIICEASHIWNNEGIFEIRAIAKDIRGKQSEWSDPLSVSMPKSKLIENNCHQSILWLIEELFNYLGIGEFFYQLLIF